MNCKACGKDLQDEEAKYIWNYVYEEDDGEYCRLCASDLMKMHPEYKEDR
jgi:hypothetical protein